jgi:hypothetical protein
LALLIRMFGGMGFKQAVQSWGLPPPGSNRGCRPEQPIEQIMVSVRCDAARCRHHHNTGSDPNYKRPQVIAQREVDLFTASPHKPTNPATHAALSAIAASCGPMTPGHQQPQHTHLLKLLQTLCIAAQSVQPKRQSTALDNASGCSRTSYFRLPKTPCTDAPNCRKRPASSSVCANTTDRRP